MRLYLAAGMQNGFYPGSTTYNKLDAAERACIDNIPHYLDSYHYVYSDLLVERIRDSGIRIFLDSGAFSAFTKGVEIDIQDYIGYCHTNADILEQVSVLDAIGDADKTWVNQDVMERAGLQPLPCYHYGEPEDVVRYYADKYEYITLGGMVPISNNQLVHWLDRIWERHLTDSTGAPKVKVHGFGLTSQFLMTRYPWYSVDSSSWLQVGAVGNVLTTEYGAISVSDNSPRAKEQGGHYDTLTPLERDAVTQLFNSRGFDIERLRTNHLSRKVFNAWTYIEMAHNMRDKELRFTSSQPVLF